MHKFLKGTLLMAIIISLQSCSVFNHNDGQLTGIEENNSFFTKDIYKKVPKSARIYFQDMKYIPRFTRSTPTYFNPYVYKKDSTLLTYAPESYHYGRNRISSPSFYISDHEVTNYEYKEFVYWVINYTARSIGAKTHPEYYLEGTKMLKRNSVIKWDSALSDALFTKDYYRNYYSASLLDTINRELLYYHFKYKVRSWEDGVEKTKVIEKAINIFPNTYCWAQEFPNIKGVEFRSQSYFTHPAYDNFPVAGVSWEQAMAYCAWRSDRLNEAILLDNKIDIGESYFNLIDFLESDSLRDEDDPIYSLIFPDFTLPTLNQWEAAAVVSDGNYGYYNFPWAGNNLRDEKGKYRANLGKIVDINGYFVKGFPENNQGDYRFTSPVKSYSPNTNGLYDMAGNIAEWTLSSSYDFPANSDLNSANYQERDTLNKYKFVKGGSWADGPVYLLWQINTQLPKNLSSSRIGFRVAMNFNENTKFNAKR